MANLLTKHITLQIRGLIMAGWPSPAEEELSDTLTFEAWLVPHKEASWLVRVSTEAMKNNGIIPGDVAILERGRNPKDGDIVVARANEQTVIRKYAIQNNHPVLAPASPGFPIILINEQVQLLGVVVTIIRKYK